MFLVSFSNVKVASISLSSVLGIAVSLLHNTREIDPVRSARDEVALALQFDKIRTIEDNKAPQGELLAIYLTQILVGCFEVPQT